MPLGAPRVSRVLVRVGAGGILGAMLVGLLSLTLVPRVYRSTATVVFPLPSGGAASLSRSLGFGGIAGMEVPTGSSFPLNTYRALLLSDQALMATNQKLQIAKLYALDSLQGTLGWFKAVVTVEIDLDRSLRLTASVPGTPSVVRPSDLFNRLAANQRDRPYRELSSKVLTALLDEMGTLADEFKVDQTKAELVAVQEMLKEKNAEQKRLRDQLDRYLMAKPMGDAGIYARAMSERYVTARSQLAKIEAALASAQRRKEVLADQVDRQVRTIEELPEEVDFLKDRRDARARASEAYAVAVSQWGPESPQVQRAKLDLEYARKQIAEAAANAKAGLTPELLKADEQIETLRVERQQQQQELSSMVGDLNDAVRRQDEIAVLNHQLDAYRSSILGLEEQLAHAQIEFSYRGIHWKIVSQPLVPISKHAPSTMLALLTGFLAGAALFGARPLVDWLMGLLASVTEAEKPAKA